MYSFNNCWLGASLHPGTALGAGGLSLFLSPFCLAQILAHGKDLRNI